MKLSKYYQKNLDKHFSNCCLKIAKQIIQTFFSQFYSSAWQFSYLE